MSSSNQRGPPQLIFDDGSRIMTESEDQDNASKTTTTLSPRGNIPLHDYYEIDRIASEVIQACLQKSDRDDQQQPPQQEQHQQQRILRVALQFPDELLSDSPEVCWLLNDKLHEDIKEWISSPNNNSNSNDTASTTITPFCFVLGDTTLNSCCPDEVAAMHLNADVLVHYGHACLSPTGSLPVIYSFGKLPVDVDETVEQLEQARREKRRSSESSERRQEQFLVVYQVGYHHAVEELQSKWKEAYQQDENQPQVIVGQIPAPQANTNKRSTFKHAASSCCSRDTQQGQSPQSCCQGRETANEYNQRSQEEVTYQKEINQSVADGETTQQPRALVVGGLELEKSISSWNQLDNVTVIFIMSDHDQGSTPQQRQYVNSMLCLLSLPTPPKEYWIYSPATKSLNTDVVPSPALRRQLKRRFFLTQKARDANVFGILVSNLSQQHLIEVVQSLQKIIQNADKSSYSFAVGKINPAKLANFAEIEVFCLVACREHSLLDHERDYPVPVITPMELEIALGGMEWGAQAYSLDCQDVMLRQESEGNGDEAASDEKNDNNDSDDDAPYFSLVTGGYVSKAGNGASSASDLDLENLPGQGQVTEYKSEAANFLKQREYQGLESKVGETEAKAAVQGLKGIASDYGGS